MRKSCKRKPRANLQDPLAYVLNGFRPVAQTAPITTVRIKNHDSLTSAAKGLATFQDMDTLMAAFNMAAAIAGLGVGTEYHAEIRAGSDAISSALRRYRYVFTGPELTAANLAMDVHDAQLEDARCTIGLVESALAVVERVLAEKKRLRNKRPQPEMVT